MRNIAIQSTALPDVNLSLIEWLIFIKTKKQWN